MTRIALVVVALWFTMSACTVPGSMGRDNGIDLSAAEAPGFLDVGLGFGVAFNTRDEDNNDARGTLVSLKAYPSGRWYSTPKKPSDRELSRDIKKAADREAARGGADAKSVQSEVDKVIANYDGMLIDDSFHLINERDNWFNRLSVFYGKSLGDFTGGGLRSSVDVIGIGYDIAPQFAIQLGYAFYEVSDNGDVDTDGGLSLSVSINLNTFKSVFSEIGS